MTFSNFIKSVEFYTGNKNWFIESGLSLSQREIVDIIHSNKFSVIYKNRQDGVSTVLGLYLMWRMIDSPGISIALLSHPGSREIFRQNINWNIERLGMCHAEHNADATTLNNGSRIIYRKGQNPDTLRGCAFDIVVLDDLPDAYQKRLIRDSAISISSSRRDSKIIIATEVAFKTTIDNSPFDFQEIYGYFFNGKRQVLVEKFIQHKRF